MKSRFTRSVATTLCVGAWLLLAGGLSAGAAWGAEVEEGFTPIFDGKTLSDASEWYPCKRLHLWYVVP